MERVGGLDDAGREEERMTGCTIRRVSNIIFSSPNERHVHTCTSSTPFQQCSSSPFALSMAIGAGTGGLNVHSGGGNEHLRDACWLRFAGRDPCFLIWSASSDDLPPVGSSTRCRRSWLCGTASLPAPDRRRSEKNGKSSISHAHGMGNIAVITLLGVHPSIWVFVGAGNQPTALGNAVSAGVRLASISTARLTVPSII